MISHEHRLIFIHLQRTGGTAIEKFFVKKDQWKIEKDRKHLLASQAKKIYKDYWNDYFKFTIVRDPWARTLSMLKFGEWLGLKKTNQGKINLDKWKIKYSVNNTNVILETDQRFYNHNQLFNKEKHFEKQVYLNILDEELDFIGNYDDLNECMNHIYEKNNLKLNFGNFFKKPNISYEQYYTEETKQQVYDLYENDIKFFNFQFGNGKLLTKY